MTHFTVRCLVSSPDEVQIEEIESPGKLTFSVRVAKGHLGKLTGIGGRLARSLRIILFAMSAEAKIKISLDLPDDERCHVPISH